MNKSELIDAIAASADIPKAVAGRALDAVIESVTGALKAGDSVVLVGFGTFAVKERCAHWSQPADWQADQHRCCQDPGLQSWQGSERRCQLSVLLPGQSAAALARAVVEQARPAEIWLGE